MKDSRNDRPIGHDVGDQPVDEFGTIRVPEFYLPLSSGLSDEAREAVRSMLQHRRLSLPDLRDVRTHSEFVEKVDAYRQELEERFLIPMENALTKAFPVEHRALTLGGVTVEEFSPVQEQDCDRVLINLHGGAFLFGAIHGGRIESIPVCSLSSTKVISIDYRQGYEHRFPAATEDVAAVYVALLERYESRKIGIYGGSAGARLVAQVLVWLIDKAIPLPGAAAILCGGGGSSGDSAYFGPVGMGESPPPPVCEGDALRPGLQADKYGYLAGVDENNFFARPIRATSEILSRFPPTMLLSATRAFDLSDVIALHRALTAAGANAALHVYDGLGHCFYYNTALPESKDAYATLVRFFDENLG